MKDPASLSAEVELDLISRAQHGDRQAFGELVRCHRTGVINVVYRMSGNVNLAEDVAQEAFIRAWTHLPGYQPRSPFRNWVYRIATNVALDKMRRERATVNLEALPLTNPGDGPEAAVLAKEQGERVRKAVLALPAASRAERPAIERSKPASCTFSISARPSVDILPTTRASRPSAANRPTNNSKPGTTFCRCSKWSNVK